ncbi:MAG TPA: MXAN_6230/SCO0854 family RING domain-containing protein [Archangium sp.]|nr:MXAN_6230/SCO0854 family RING domain-containing protein [Archangium sp.]
MSPLDSASADASAGLDALLLRKAGLVFLPPRSASAGRRSRDGLRALETDLLGLGYTLSKELQEALRALPEADLARVGQGLFDALAVQLGAHRHFVPLFRSFPSHIPEDTHALYVQRVCFWLYQVPEQPCILCGQVDAVHALAPCAHVVCGHCFDGANYSACPICNQRIALDSPFLEPTSPALSTQAHRAYGHMTRLSLGSDRETAARELLVRLASRPIVLSPDEVDTLKVLVAAVGSRVVTWLPPRVPVKETLAHVLGALLRDARTAGDVLPAAAAHVQTATDVLRVLVAWLGGNPDLTVKVPLRSFPRPLRRAVARMLESFSLLNLTEDVQRHPGLWKALAGQLHLFEDWRQHPKVALAFAALRRTRLDARTEFGRAVQALAEQHPSAFQLQQTDAGTQVRFRSWASNVEARLRTGDLPGVLPLLGQRPGEFLRRMDHVTRLVLVHEARAELEPRLHAAVEAMAPRASAPLLLMVAAHLRRRHAPFGRRVFFPKGEAMHAWGTEDRRALLPGDVVGPLVARLEEELLRRAQALPSFPHALLDESLKDLLVPFAQKTASRALVAVPRGSVLRLPESEQLRFFVHWMEPKNTRVDLDLSVALYDEKWWLVSLCDFTQLSLPDGAAVHSGDITSGAAPLGGAEFLDVDIPRLRAQGVRYLVPVVFSFNSVSFDRMDEAFAGFMPRPDASGPHFDAAAVSQRFDLQGNAKISVPLLIDLEAGAMRWVDVKIPPEGQFHSVGRSRGPLAFLGKDTSRYFGTGARPTLWELASLHAAARCRTVYVRRRDGQVAAYQRALDESVAAFLRRVRGLGETDTVPGPRLGTLPALFAGLEDDAALPPGSEGYALRFRHTSAEQVKRLAPGDLLSLRPTAAR